MPECAKVSDGKGAHPTASFIVVAQYFLQFIGQCLDMKDGVTTNGNPVQTWECSPDNQNQVWVTVNNL
jgi:hypothetical protein